jgi:UDP-4-amino-4,6-dideoxy-N-acetyl-beta-L-altrosamine N-acetyltransferase
MYAHIKGNPKLLLGMQYAMVRKEVREVAALHLPTREGEIFVAMGGADFLGLTAPIVEALATTGLPIRVAVGHANSQRAQIQELADQIGHVTLIEQHDYVASLASAHVAVLAAGSSLWEACAVGTPSIGLVVANNQFASANAAKKLGFTRIVDCRVLFNIDAVLSEVQTCILNGTSEMRGAALSTGVASSLRVWRNDPAVSKWMYTNHLISENEHSSWFDAMLLDSTKVYWKIVADDIAVGAVFLTGVSDQEKSCEWGMYLANVDVRGKGVAQAACALSLQFAFNDLGMKVVKCEAIEQNEIAIGLYESVGYVRTGVQANAVKRGDEMLSVVTLELTRESWNTTVSQVLQKLSEKGVIING